MPRFATIVCFTLALAATLAFGDTPVKTHSTLFTPDQIAERKNTPWFVNLNLKGDTRPFCAAVGTASAEQWVNKPDDWFWQTMPSTKIMRCTTVGNDNHRTPKAGCPVHLEKIYEIEAYYPWIVDVEKAPYKLKCPFDGALYPSNDFAAGDLTTGPYADDGRGWDREGQKFYFLGLYSHYAYNTMLQPAIKAFGHAYMLTGDKRYAHKAAVCLLKEAFEYPNSTDRKDRTYQPGYGKQSGMITDVVWSGPCLVASATCYDEICEALEGDSELVAFAQKYVPEIKTIEDVKVYIEDHTFRAGLQALLDGRILPNTGWAEEAMSTLALMMNDFGPKKPNTVDCLEWLYYGGGRLVTVGNQFYKDGGSYESTGYNDARGGFVRSAGTLKRLRALSSEALDWERYPDISQNEKLLAYGASYNKAIHALGGQYTVCVGDIGNTAISHKAYVGKNERPSEYLDGYGLGLLRSGHGTDQRDATLFYGGVRGHAHYDPLTLGLYGFGRDLLPNIGYPQSWNFAHAWEWALFTHNTVVVDRDDKPCSTVLGSLTVWSPGSEGLQVMEASKRPYRKHEPRGETGPDVTDYRRMVALIDIAPEQWYAVDIFRVTGGSDHLQSWHGGYTPNPVTIEGVELTKQAKGTLAGENVEYGTHYKDASGADRWDPYCYLKDVARGPMQPLTSVDFPYATEDNLHLRLSFVPMDDTELITARGGAPIAPDKEVLQWAIPHRSLSGAAGSPPALGGPAGMPAPGATPPPPTPLQSQFVTVLDAYLDQRVLGPIKRLPAQAVGKSDYAPIALEITVPGGRDLILANGSETASLKCGEFALTGKFGLIRERGGKVTDLRLVAGSKLSAGKLQVTQPVLPAAKIVAVDRAQRTVTVEGKLPPLGSLKGSRIVIDNHGERLSSYTILAASKISVKRTLLTLDSSGNIGEGIAADFKDGFIQNGPEVAMPLAGLVKIGDRFDYSDCYYNGGHLENGKPGVDYKVHGVMGFPYQAWGDLHNPGTNHVVLYDKVPAGKLKESLGQDGRWVIYEYGVGDEVRFDSGAGLVVK